MDNSNRWPLLLSQLSAIICGLTCIVLYPVGIDSKYQITYVLCFILTAIGCRCFFVSWNKRDGFFNPMSVITLIYVMMYGVCPIYDICRSDFLWFGYDLFAGGPLGSLIALAGYICFAVMYQLSWRRATEPVPSTPFGEDGLQFEGSAYVLPVLLVMYGISFAANAYYMVGVHGNSLLYSLSFGFLGSGGGEASDTALGAIGMFSYCLPAITLAYCELGKGKLLKLVLFYLMISLQVTRGFRFLIFQIAVMFFCYYRIKNGKLPNARVMALVVVLFSSAIMYMTLFRNDVRSGLGADLSQITSESLLDAFDGMFWDNLRIYKNYYGMVMNIPSKVPYEYLYQIVFGTMLMFIPRAIWPGKPSQFGEGLETIIGQNFNRVGQAYPNLGEYWYAFGWPAVIMFMVVYAWWMKRCAVKYGASSDLLKQMIFAVLVSVNLQLIIRGYTPSNFWLVVFSVAPLIIIRPLCEYLAIRFGDPASAGAKDD